jgi:hypothetical protein
MTPVRLLEHKLLEDEPQLVQSRGLTTPKSANAYAGKDTSEATQACAWKDEPSFGTQVDTQLNTQILMGNTGGDYSSTNCEDEPRLIITGF